MYKSEYESQVDFHIFDWRIGSMVNVIFSFAIAVALCQLGVASPVELDVTTASSVEQQTNIDADDDCPNVRYF